MITVKNTLWRAMCKVKLFSQLHRHARVQSDVCTFKHSSLMFYIQFKEKSNRNYSNVLTLQSLLLGFRSCSCCCCPNEYVLVFSYSRESAQIPSLRFLWSVLPCWLHMRSIAFLRQLSVLLQNRLLHTQYRCGHNRENELRTFVWIYHNKSFWSVWVELQQKYCFSFERRG